MVRATPRKKLRSKAPEPSRAKSALVARIAAAIARLRLTQSEAGDRLGLTQPKISHLLRGDAAGYSVERLARFLNGLGVNVQISLLDEPRGRIGRTSVIGNAAPARRPLGRKAALARLARIRPELNRLHINRIAIFGSVARDEAAADSDIDLLVEFDPVPSLFELATVQQRLDKLLGRHVDLVTPDALHPALRERILSEAVYA